MAILIEPPQLPQNELFALQNLSDTVGFLRKTGDGTYLIDTSTYLTANQSISISGDASGTGTNSINLTLANSGVTAGTYNNSATQVRPFTVDAKGRITGIGTPVNIALPWSAVTGKPTTLNGYGITDALPLSGGTVTGVTIFSNATPSTSTTTGAVVVSGGVGVGGAIFAGSYNLIPVGRGGGNIDSNIVIGVSAGLANTTGSSNSFVGVNAGRYIGNGVTELTVINNSCFFGMNTKGTQNATNENVFGFNATGNGSNTVTIGDDNITNNFFRGALSLNANQVISTRRTGWDAPTGTATRTTFATSTVTLPQLAERVKALIDDLTTHGLIGA